MASEQQQPLQTQQEQDRQPDANVDDTPISPISQRDRRDSLEKHLQHRPEVQDLKNRHILLDTNAAP